MAESHILGRMTVEVGVDVSLDTVELCLKIIEYYLNRNPNKRIRGGYRESGRVEPFTITTVSEDENDGNTNEHS